MLNGLILVLAGWLLISPFAGGYTGTDAGNDLFLGQIGAGVAIGATTLPRVAEPHRHPRLTLITAVAAVLLLLFPWFTGAAVNDEPPGLPAGAEDNGYAPYASANAMITSAVVLLLTAATWLRPRPATRRREAAGPKPTNDPQPARFRARP